MTYKNSPKTYEQLVHIREVQEAHVKSSRAGTVVQPPDNRELLWIRLILGFGMLVGAITFLGCAIVSKFDQGSLDSDMNLKRESLALIRHATEPAADYSQEIAALNSDLSSMIAKEKGKGTQNFVIQKQWDLLTSPDHLLGRFLKDWQAGKTYSQTMIDEETILIGDAFDQLITSETSKIH